MNIGSRRLGWVIRIGRDFWYDALLSIEIGVGFRQDAELGEIPWRHYWRWSSASLPALIFRQMSWRGIVITLPAGFRAFGRQRIYF